MAYGAGVNNMGVSSSSPAQRTSVSVWDMQPRLQSPAPLFFIGHYSAGRAERKRGGEL